MKTLLRPFQLFGLLLCVLVGLAASMPAGAADATNSPTIQIGGEVEKPLTLTREELRALPRVKLEAKEPHTEDRVTYEGVALHELLKKAGIPNGETLRGRAMSLAVLITAADNYQSAFSLAELDPAFLDKTIILADTADGKDLDTRRGPFRLVIPDEKRPSRWVRQIVRIDVVRVSKS